MQNCLLMTFSLPESPQIFTTTSKASTRFESVAICSGPQWNGKLLVNWRLFLNHRGNYSRVFYFRILCDFRSEASSRLPIGSRGLGIVPSLVSGMFWGAVEVAVLSKYTLSYIRKSNFGADAQRSFIFAIWAWKRQLKNSQLTWYTHYVAPTNCW